MKIGITMRVVKNETYVERRDALSSDWSEYIQKIIPNALLIPITNQPLLAKRLISKLKLDGIILSNGNSWGEAPERDLTEEIILNHCLKGKIPLLGVCRGLQVLNILFGGQIEKNLLQVTGEKHVGNKHDVELLPAPFIKNTTLKMLKVNSFHNQGVVLSGLSKKLKIFAQSGRVVEGLYHPNKPILAIQWHPERQSPNPEFNASLIRNFFINK